MDDGKEVYGMGYDEVPPTMEKEEFKMYWKPGLVIEYDPKEEQMKIKVLLKVLDKHNLIFKVLWMDERFRGAYNSYFAEHDIANDIEIRSNTHTAIHSDLTAGVYTIYLQGSASYFNDMACIAYVKDAFVEKDRIIAALKDWALNWDGFKDVDLKEKDSDDDIYCI